jgi:uncharacterized C2H2 Zn-finger protein
MQKYECDKCHLLFNHKKEYLRHINKQKKCTENHIYECVECHKIYKYKSDYDRHINKKTPCKIINEENNDIIKCNECLKEFTTMRSLKRHQKEYCNKLEFTDKDELIKMVKELKRQINDKDNNINNKNDIFDKDNIIDNNKNNNNDLDKTTINNTNHAYNTQSYNTINNSGNTTNIIINAYGKEDLSHITDKDYKTLFTKCNSLIPALIELIHFNENKPENKNVYISNIKSQYVNVYDGKQWNLMNKHELFDDIYDNKCIIIIDKFDDMKEILNKNTIELFSKFIDKHETKTMKKNMTDKIQLLLYNNRNTIHKI